MTMDKNTNSNRLTALSNAFIEELANPTDWEKQLCKTAAAISLKAEDMFAAWLRGERIDVEHFIALNTAFADVLEELRIPERGPVF